MMLKFRTKVVKKTAMRVGLFFSLILLTFLLSGCETYEQLKAKAFPTEEISLFNQSNTCPAVVCGEDIDAAIYYFDGDVNYGLNLFIDKSNSQISCAIQRVEQESFAKKLLSKNSDENKARLLLDTRTTMDCAGACVPYAKSQYNFLYAQSFSVAVVDDLHENFCVSEQGVYIFTKNVDNSDDFEHGLFLRSAGLKDVFASRFETLWSKKR